MYRSDVLPRFGASKPRRDKSPVGYSFRSKPTASVKFIEDSIGSACMTEPCSKKPLSYRAIYTLMLASADEVDLVTPDIVLAEYALSANCFWKRSP